MLSIDKPAKEVKCEDLVKVTIRDDSEKFFLIRSSYLNKREREADRVP